MSASPNPVTLYVCRVCGYHPGNTGGWCAGGCGRDYNEMRRVEYVPTTALDGALESAQQETEALKAAQAEVEQLRQERGQWYDQNLKLRAEASELRQQLEEALKGWAEDSGWERVRFVLGEDLVTKP